MRYPTTDRLKLLAVSSCALAIVTACGGGGGSTSQPSIAAANPIAAPDTFGTPDPIGTPDISSTPDPIGVPDISSTPDPSGTLDTTGPDVVSITPVKDAKRVEVEANILATFDEPLLLSSIDNSSFKLSHRSAHVPAQVTVNSNTAILNPDATLLPSSLYEVTLSDSIADISGNPTAGAQWSFWTDGNGWAPNLTIKNDTKGYALDWDIGVDSSGNSIAVWVQNNNSSFDVYASRYDTQTQLWTTTTLNQNADYWNVENVKISVNAAGNAIVYWERAAPDNLYSKGYTASWYDPEANQWSNSRTLDAIGDNHTLSAKPLIDLDDDGNAIAVWKENSFQAQGVYSSQYNSETRQWGIAQPAGLHDDHYIKALASSTYSAGGILAVWVETEGWITSIYANQYDFTKDRWESAQIIATSDSRVEQSLSLLDTLEISVDLDGNAIVVWDETKSGGHSQIRSSRYNATTKAWGTPELVASPWSTEPPQLSINTNGNTIAAWDAYVGREINGDPKYALRFSQYDIKNSVWTPAQSTHPSIERSMVDSQIGTNSMGDTFIVWSQYEGSRYRVFSSNLDPQTGAWTNPDVIESNSTPLTSSRGPKIAKGSSTGPVIVWAQDSGSSSNLQWTRFERRVVE